jgi:histidinol-phosphatase
VVYAAKGQGAWWQTGQGAPRRAQVSRIGSLSEATFCATNMLRWEKVGRWPNFMHMLRNCGLARGWGDCFGHILVATGRAEIMVDPQLTPWDSAALLPIVEEAGGHFLDLQGNATIYGGSGFSVNAQLKDEVLKLLNQTEFM